MAEQSYAKHVKWVPGYHFVAGGILAINFLWSIYRVFRPAVEGTPVFDRLLGVAVALALLLLLWYLRVFPLSAQDRVIRLEETQRLQRLLPPDLQPRIGELRRGQLIALRFAGDEELPELTRAVLDGKLSTQDDIKKAIRSWRADHFRL
jgi:Family of unknown function (DUF6526)